MQRRRFLQVTAQGAELGALGHASAVRAQDEPETVVMYDTHAIALYFDGTMGPKTGIIYVDYILDNVPVTLLFWHGHGGKRHEFTLT